MSTSVIFGSLSCWLLYGAALNPLLLEAIIHIYVGFTIPENIGYTNLSHQLDLSHESVQLLLNYQKAIQLGTDQMETIAGYNEEYDQVSSKLRCTPEYTDDPHMEYSCLGLDQAFQFAAGYVNTIWKTKRDYTFSNGDKRLNDQDVGHLIHIFASHICDYSRKQSELLNHLGDIQIQSFQDNLLICIIVNVFASLIAFIWMTYIPRSYDQAFSGAMLVFRRLEPAAVLLNQELTSFLLHQGKSSTRNDMSFSHKVINNSINPIIIVNSQQIIETANLKINEIFNYNPEQLIGQTASLIFANEFKETVHDQMNLMRLGQTSNDYSGHVTCLTSSNQEIPCLLTIVPNRKGGDVISFSLILNDERDLFQKKEQAESAEERYRTLLFNVFPKDIVANISENHQISFVTHDASVMFINIQKFSDYSAALSPSDTLNTLSHVFSAFDACLPSYQNITKLKIVGDSYMCASGLFKKSTEAEPFNHAEELINFGLDCLKALDEVNISLQAELVIRIAVHTGGPIFCGVIGKEQPFFEILGDTIRTAFFLQSLCLRGQVLISQAVYDLVNSCGFIIKPHQSYRIQKSQTIPTYLVSFKVQPQTNNPSSAFSGILIQNSSLSGNLPLATQQPPS